MPVILGPPVRNFLTMIYIFLILLHKHRHTIIQSSLDRPSFFTNNVFCTEILRSHCRHYCRKISDVERFVDKTCTRPIKRNARFGCTEANNFHVVKNHPECSWYSDFRMIKSEWDEFRAYLSCIFVLLLSFALSKIVDGFFKALERLQLNAVLIGSLKFLSFPS